MAKKKMVTNDDNHRPCVKGSDAQLSSDLCWKKAGIVFNKKRDEGFFAAVLFFLYRFSSRIFRCFLIKMMWHAFGSHYQFYSKTLRKIFSRYYGIDVGLYSHGGCFVIGKFPAGTKIGRYCSIAVTASALNVNHPMNLKSSHAFFFNPEVGYSNSDFVRHTQLTIGNDVWIGHNAIIVSSCSNIGDGAVIGAGAVVTKNIPPYAVVVANPGRIVRYRFSEKIIAELIESRWWDRPIEDLLSEFESFQAPLEADEVR